jgi:hypothetical protein
VEHPQGVSRGNGSRRSGDLSLVPHHSPLMGVCIEAQWIHKVQPSWSCPALGLELLPDKPAGWSFLHGHLRDNESMAHALPAGETGRGCCDGQSGAGRKGCPGARLQASEGVDIHILRCWPYRGSSVGHSL